MKKQLLLGTVLFLSMFGGQILPVQGHVQGNSFNLQAVCSSTGSDTKIIQKPSSSDSNKPALRLISNSETETGAVTKSCTPSSTNAQAKVLNPVGQSNVQENSETDSVMLEGLVDVLPANLS